MTIEAPTWRVRQAEPVVLFPVLKVERTQSRRVGKRVRVWVRWALGKSQPRVKSHPARLRAVRLPTPPRSQTAHRGPYNQNGAA